MRRRASRSYPPPDCVGKEDADGRDELWFDDLVDTLPDDVDAELVTLTVEFLLLCIFFGIACAISKYADENAVTRGTS